MLRDYYDDDLYIRDPNDTAQYPGSIIWDGPDYDPDREAATSALCFSKSATVRVMNQREPIAMKDLRVGDYVLTYLKHHQQQQQQQQQYEQVYAFAHRNENRSVEFLQIYTNDTQQPPLEISTRHMVYLENKKYPITADRVQVGDVLKGIQVLDNGDTKTTTTTPKWVTKISKTTKHGLYAPLTTSGTIVVNGIVASAYTSLQENSNKDHVELLGMTTPLSQQGYCHLGLSPFRLICTLSRSLCHRSNPDGMPHYIAWSVRVTNWVYEQPWMIQVAYLLLFFVSMTTCVMFEKICNPLALCAVAVIFAFYKNFRIKITRIDKNQNRSSDSDNSSGNSN